MEKVTVTTSKVTLRGQIMTCAAGHILFDECGGVEITFDQAELIRNVKHLSFSDRPDLIEDAKVIDCDDSVDKVISASTMPMSFDPPPFLENLIKSEEAKEEVSEEVEPMEDEKVQLSKDLKKLNSLKVQMDRLNAIGGFDAIVPSEGIVFKYNGKTYKFTGAFAPINQITGLISF